jgi:predicted ATP-grasp superfamily ATP-dependent carboligase
MANILFTGGRAPATLELVRAFHRAGHTVFMAESLRGHLSEASNAIAKNFYVPPPRQQPAAFTDALRKIIVENRINMLIPTCEEVFYVAKAREEFPCAVFVESIKKLNDVHNKWHFVINAIGHDLYAPETMYLNNQDDMLHAFAHWRELVLKPVYSRFAARTLILPTLKHALYKLTVNSKAPWVAQEYVKGRQICTYSVCHNGRVTAHTAYPSTFTAGQGATIAFKHIDHPAIYQWVRTFVDRNHFTGQIAFDFIEGEDGQLYGLECNPRATSGVHLLASHPNFVEAFLNSNILCITPNKMARPSMLGTAMLIYGLPRAIKKKQFIQWIKTFFTSNDVILNFKDIKPFIMQFKSIFAYLFLARKEKITALQASTFDIEWNGEM